MNASNAQDYKNVLGRFCTGVTVVASLDDGEPVGFTCQSFAALSLAPPLISLSPRVGSATWSRIRRSGRFAVSMLAADQRPVADRFARSGVDKFAGVGWHPSPAGTPVIDGALGWVECTLRQEIEAGDHTIVVGSVDALGAAPTGAPLLFFRGKYFDAGMKDSVIA